jgi:hypothetical protein
VGAREEGGAEESRKEDREEVEGQALDRDGVAIVVQKLIKGSAGLWQVEALFGDRTLVVDLAAANARELVGKLVFVELSIERIVACVPSTDESGISALPGGWHRIVGEIEDQMEIGSGTVLYDLFIEPGPDYLALDSNDLGGAVLTPGDRVAVDVSGLRFYPTGT